MSSNIDKALGLSVIGQSKQAIDLLNNEAISQPNNSEIHYTKALIFVKIHDLQSALLSLDKAIELNSNEVDYFTSKGNLLIQVNREQEAVQYFDRAIELSPNEITFLSKGNCYYNTGKLKEALTLYKKALDFNKSSGPAMLSIANTHLQLHHYEDSLFFYEKYSAFGTETAKVLKNKAVCCFYLGRTKDALKLINESLGKAENDSSLNFKGGVAFTLSEFELALSCYSKALSLTKKPLYMYNAGLLCEKTNKISDAEDFYKNALIANKNFIPAFIAKMKLDLNKENKQLDPSLINIRLSLDKAEFTTEEPTVNYLKVADKEVLIERLNELINANKIFDFSDAVVRNNLLMLIVEVILLKGKLLWAINNIDESLLCFEEAIKLIISNDYDDIYKEVMEYSGVSANLLSSDTFKSKDNKVKTRTSSIKTRGSIAVLNLDLGAIYLYEALLNKSIVMKETQMPKIDQLRYIEQTIFLIPSVLVNLISYFYKAKLLFELKEFDRAFEVSNLVLKLYTENKELNFISGDSNMLKGFAVKLLNINADIALIRKEYVKANKHYQSILELYDIKISIEEIKKNGIQTFFSFGGSGLTLSDKTNYSAMITSIVEDIANTFYNLSNVLSLCPNNEIEFYNGNEFALSKEISTLSNFYFNNAQRLYAETKQDFFETLKPISWFSEIRFD